MYFPQKIPVHANSLLVGRVIMVVTVLNKVIMMVARGNVSCYGSHKVNVSVVN